MRINPIVRNLETILKLSSGSTISPDPFPGSPVIKSIDKIKKIVVLSIALSGEQTQSAFKIACDVFNEEVKRKEYSVPGFRPGSKLPAAYLYQIFGEDQIKKFCSTVLVEDIQIEADRSGLSLVGQGRISDFKADQFTPGKQHNIDIECDLWPEISYGGEKGYKGLKVTVTKGEFDNSKFNKVKTSILERYKLLETTPADYRAKLGDVVVANMKGYEKKPNGEKGSPLPAIATGDNVEITLEKGKFMEGLIEGLEGAAAGETKTITVKFPVRAKGKGSSLSGVEAIFEVQVSAVKAKVLPEWNEALAARIRDGMTLDVLEGEVRSAVEGDMQETVDIKRNDALATALLEIVSIDKLPDSLVEENTQAKFQAMLMDFKEQGSTDEQLAEYSSPENYEKYKVVSKVNVEKVVKLGLIFRDIAEKEGVVVTEEEVKSQLDILLAQAKQKNEPEPDLKRAGFEIENVLLRKKVFELLAAAAEITWLEPESVV